MGIKAARQVDRCTKGRRIRISWLGHQSDESSETRKMTRIYFAYVIADGAKRTKTSKFERIHGYYTEETLATRKRVNDRVIVPSTCSTCPFRGSRLAVALRGWQRSASTLREPTTDRKYFQRSTSHNRISCGYLQKDLLRYQERSIYFGSTV